MTTAERLKILEGMGTCHTLDPKEGGYAIIFHRHSDSNGLGLAPHTTKTHTTMTGAVVDLYNYLNCRIWLQIELAEAGKELSALKSRQPTLIVP